MMNSITCAYCGKQFETPYAQKRYCSPTCKKRMSYKVQCERKNSPVDTREIDSYLAPTVSVRDLV